MKVIQKGIMAENIEKVQSYLGSILANLHRKKIQSNKAKYEQQNGLSKYKHDVGKVETTFRKRAKEFDPDEVSLFTLLAFQKL